MKRKHISLLSVYVIGFCFSIVLTSLAYLVVTEHLLSGMNLLMAIIGLALVQLVVQMFCFLHLGQESKPRWNLIFFISTLGIILIVVVGSIWIMTHLNYNMSPKEMRTYIQSQDGI